jgi:hypothetical protein
VVREGNGWKEVEGSEPGKTVFVITTDDPQSLAEIARSHPDPKIRAEALGKVSDPSVLAEVARGDQDVQVRRSAVARLNDEAVLKEIAQSDKDASVKAAAAARADILKTIAASHPEYKHWASCKIGSWVRMRVDLKVEDARSSVEVQRTLLECRADKVILEQKVVSTGAGLKGYSKELFGRFDVEYGQKSEDDENLKLAGKTVKCRWVQCDFQSGRDIAHVRRWRFPEIPGGLARIDIEVSPEGEPLQYMTAVATGWEKR